jgi:transcriptional regulator with PAS, ATPase and Fis domain
LIRGESGTGKDIVARLIHEADGRDGSFVKINCPTIPEALLESELFGHEPGAFTGAERRKPGRFELAAGGTIFLDEIGEIPGGVQSKLLQAIEHKQFTRLGGGATINTDARIVAATNAPLEDMIVERRFRSDLFYRLNQYAIELPPLRERSEDVPLLIDHFLQIYGVKHARPDLTLSPAMMSRLVRYSWPGNVRELEAVMHRFVLTGREDAIESAMERKPERARKDSPLGELRQSEIRTLMAALTEARWNQRQAAGILGISYSSLRRRVKKYNLKLRWLQEHKSAGEP